MFKDENLIELMNKEIFGNREAQLKAIWFFRDLADSEKLEITRVQYGDKRAYSGYDILEIFFTARDTISFEDGEWVFQPGTEIILSVGIDEEFNYDLSTELTEIVKVPMGTGVWWSDWNLKNYEYIDFDKAYSI